MNKTLRNQIYIRLLSGVKIALIYKKNLVLFFLHFLFAGNETFLLFNNKENIQIENAIVHLNLEILLQKLNVDQKSK